jgi:hypothetical protein
MNKRLIHAAVISSLFAATQVYAIEFDGFATMGVSMNDQEDGIVYLDSVNPSPGFLQDAKFGLQMTADVAENMDVVAQLLARGTQDDFNLVTSWAYLDVALSNNFKVRAGKMKEPVYLISDYYEVAYAYPWIRPPQEVYINNPVRTLNGLIFQYSASAGGVNYLVQPYFGTNSEPIPGTDGAARFQAEDYVGLALSMSNSAFTFQVSSFTTNVTTQGFMPVVDSDGNPANGFNTPFNGNGDIGTMTLMNVAGEGKASLTNVGLSWDIANFVGYTEYVTRDITDELELMFPDQKAYYVTLGYRIGKFMPHVTFAHSEAEPLAFDPFNPITAFASIVAINQDTTTLGLRYEINDSAAFKIELSQVSLDEATMPSAANGYVGGNGLYTDSITSFGMVPEPKSNMISMSVDVIF